MEPPAVQYATTSDGVSIAWAEAGHGTPLLLCPPTPFTHVQQQVAVLERFYGALARSFRLITFDARGTGMSERDVADVSTATLLIDAETVIDAAQLDRFALVESFSFLALSTALQLATAHRESVTHLVLESPHQNMADVADTSYGRVGLALAERDWTAYVQTLLRVFVWEAAPSPYGGRFAMAAPGWVDPAVGLQYTRAMEAIDVGDLLPQVRQPTLVLRNDRSFIPARSCQRIAAKIPGAQFLQYADPTHMQMVELIRAFVSEPSPPSGSDLLPPRGRAASASRTIIYTDIEANTELLQRLGDDAWRSVLRDHERITREQLTAHGGTEVKTMGDGFMASFDSATSAVECAIGLQRAFAARNASAAEPLRVRIGINAGEPIAEDDDLFGTAVTMASRIMGQGQGGEILVSDVVRGLVAGKGFLFADRGVVSLKGFEDPVRLYEVRWQKE